MITDWQSARLLTVFKPEIAAIVYEELLILSNVASSIVVNDKVLSIDTEIQVWGVAVIKQAAQAQCYQDAA